MGLSDAYLSVFSLFLGLISAAMVGASIYLIVKEKSDLTKAILGISCYYALVALMGLGFKSFLGGDAIWTLLLCALFIFQFFLFIVFVFYPHQTLTKLGEYATKGNDTPLVMSYNFVSNNFKFFQAAMGILAGAILLALLCLCFRNYRRQSSSL